MDKTQSIIWTAKEAAVVTGGTSTRDWFATGVSLNAAEIKPGDLYVATQDDDLEQVFRKGAAAAMISGRFDVAGDWPLLKVASVFEALQALAAAGRYKTHGTIISVPSCSARKTVHDLIIKAATVYEGGRHLSVGLAGIPEDVEYGLFGSSPAVRPDIVVIASCGATNSDALFETMPVQGTAIIHAESDEFLSVVARARAAGVRNIFTYGAHAGADAALREVVYADNGTRLSVKILEEEHYVLLPAGHEIDPAFVAGLLILKLTGKKLSKVIRMCGMDSVNAGQCEGNTHLLDMAAIKEAQAVFRVTNLIDLGFGRQTAVLDGLVHSVHKALGWPGKNLEIPARGAGFNLMYTSRKFTAVPSAHAAIKAQYRDVEIETIAPDVVVPGDFLVFKDRQKQKSAIFSEALRLIKPKGIKHAL